MAEAAEAARAPRLGMAGEEDAEARGVGQQLAELQRLAARHTLEIASQRQDGAELSSALHSQLSALEVGVEELEHGRKAGRRETQQELEKLCRGQASLQAELRELRQTGTLLDAAGPAAGGGLAQAAEEAEALHDVLRRLSCVEQLCKMGCGQQLGSRAVGAAAEVAAVGVQVAALREQVASTDAAAAETTRRCEAEVSLLTDRLHSLEQDRSLQSTPGAGARTLIWEKLAAVEQEQAKFTACAQHVSELRGRMDGIEHAWNVLDSLVDEAEPQRPPTKAAGAAAAAAAVTLVAESPRTPARGSAGELESVLMARIERLEAQFRQLTVELCGASHPPLPHTHVHTRARAHARTRTHARARTHAHAHALPVCRRFPRAGRRPAIRLGASHRRRPHHRRSLRPQGRAKPAHDGLAAEGAAAAPAADGGGGVLAARRDGGHRPPEGAPAPSMRLPPRPHARACTLRLQRRLSELEAREAEGRLLADKAGRETAQAEQALVRFEGLSARLEEAKAEWSAREALGLTLQVGPSACRALHPAPLTPVRARPVQGRLARVEAAHEEGLVQAESFKDEVSTRLEDIQDGLRWAVASPVATPSRRESVRSHSMHDGRPHDDGGGSVSSLGGGGSVSSEASLARASTIRLVDDWAEEAELGDAGGGGGGYSLEEMQRDVRHTRD
eukprot:SAG11_NODE_481_length_9096_cov_5.142381_5_plen_673_part_01